MDVAALETLLRGENSTLDAERAALANGRWEHYLRTRVPPPLPLFVLRRASWNAAFRRALDYGVTSEIRSAAVAPIWYANNEDEIPTSEWQPAIMVSYNNSADVLCEHAGLTGAVILARLEVTRVGYLAPSAQYAPSVALRYRNRHYVADQSEHIGRVVDLQRVITAPAAARPTLDVPAFAIRAVPAVDLTAVEPALATRIRRATEALQVSPDED
jgi:hypothetical protein